MNKYQEALDELSYPLPDSSCGGCKCGESDCSCKKSEAVKTLNELVEKTTPKKVKYNKSPHGNGYMYSCPVCGRMFGVNCKPSYMNFCDDCGQPIDWSEEE